jgi:hypothetical protein
MPNNIILKASSPSLSSLTEAVFITKEYDGGDASLKKSYSRVNVTYSMEGSGVSPLQIKYRIEGSSWKYLVPDPVNRYSVLKSSRPKFLRTHNHLKTAVFKFPEKEVGRSISLKLELSTIGQESADFEKFILSDITFTFRIINRK